MSQPDLGRILVVDDEANIADSVKRALERVGYAVDVASDPERAWARLEQTAPDVVICDVRLQEADGMALLGRIQECYPEIAVIMMTGYASVESAVSAIKAGALDYLAKPFNPEQLRVAVARAMEQRRLVDENLYLKSELEQVAHGRFVIGQMRERGRALPVLTSTPPRYQVLGLVVQS